MWNRFTNAIRSHTSIAKEDVSANDTQRESEVILKVREEHPNLSHFYQPPSENGTVTQPTPDASSSPSVHSKKNMLKRLSRPTLKDDTEGQRSPSPFKLPTPLGKKSKPTNDLNEDTLPPLPALPTDLPRRASTDVLRNSPEMPRPSFDTTRSAKDPRSRASLDMLRSESPVRFQDTMRIKNSPVMDDFDSPANPHGLGFHSVRSILRDPNTPGTGQNVRFFSKESFKVITPDQSSSSDLMNKPQPPIPGDQLTFMERLTQPGSPDTPPSLAKSHTKSRPSINEIFSPLSPEASTSHLAPPSGVVPDSTPSDMSISSPVFPGNIPTMNSNLFEVSDHLDLPDFPPPTLGFDINAPFDSPDLNLSGAEEQPSGQSGTTHMTSTPARDSKGKGKEKSTEEFPAVGSIDVPAPTVVDEGVFHSRERPPQFPSVLHDRSQSLTLGKTVFFSMDQEGASQTSSAYPSSDNVRPSTSLEQDSPSPKPTPASFSKARTRALSDTVFQSMLRAAPQIKNEAGLPEADINDMSSGGLVVYTPPTAEPDPFNANANTYYTPQTMIPTTPPKGAPKHNRKTSKEENLIISLQTQLALRTELCSQYETDLKARDELVEILGKKLADMEKDEAKRKNALRAWKKKVQDLERACRLLEEEVEGSRQESMERSVMDEASGEALRMLHRQIAHLENEKSEWMKKEEAMKDEVEKLEQMLNEKSRDVHDLRESIWNREESEREIQAGIREAKEQIDMMGNISIAFDEDEMKRLMQERGQNGGDVLEEAERLRGQQFRLQQEIDELKTQCENLVVERNGYEEKMVDALEKLKVRDDEYAVLKTELEAQWDGTERTGEQMKALEAEKEQLRLERDSLKKEVEELEKQAGHMEVDWNETENKKNELESELQEVWNLKDGLEKERDLLEDELQQQREQVEHLTHELGSREHRISELESERDFALDNVARLEENIRERDQELARFTQLSIAREEEAERLREDLSRAKREHAHIVEQQSRQLRDAAGLEDATKERLDELVRAKAQADVELKTTRDRVSLLTEDVDRLRRQVHTLQLESADKEVKIVQMNKQHAQDKEDIQGLNIALDSKQQELELIKRKLGVRGTAGSTPASNKTSHHRRDSSVFNATPLSSGSRPPSAMSDAGTESSVSAVKKKLSSEGAQSASAGKPLALGKSARINATITALNNAASSSSVSASRSMGPPALKSRPSMGTPTPLAKSNSLLARSSGSSLGKGLTSPTSISADLTPVARKRTPSSSGGDQGPKRTTSGTAALARQPSIDEHSDSGKENYEDSTPNSLSARRRSFIPTPVLASPM